MSLHKNGPSDPKHYIELTYRTVGRTSHSHTFSPERSLFLQTPR